MEAHVPRKEPIEARFWRHVATAGRDDCWLWTGATNANGYGTVNVNRRSSLAHRVSWSMRWERPVPEGRCILHECDVRACVNPLHLWLGTQRDNVADMRAKGRSRSGVFEAAKTHCPAGHPYAGENLYIRPSGKFARECLTCRREIAARRRHNTTQQPRKAA